MEPKTSIKDQRAKTLNGLRLNLNQDQAWKSQLLGLVEELNHDVIRLRVGYSQLKKENEDLKERFAVPV